MSIDSIPFQLKYIADEEPFRRQFGSLQRRYPLATFDKESAMRVSQSQFISFGDPLFEALMIWVERNLADTLSQGAIFTDPDGRLDGILLFYQGEILDGRGHIAGTRLFALLYDVNSGEITSVNPAILWDLKEGGTYSDYVDYEGLKRKTFTELLPELEKYKETLLAERERQAAIKEKYGVRSLEHLILKLDGDLIGLYSRREMGENVERFIKPKEDQKAGYENALRELKTGLQQERSLSIGSPRFIGMARIVPEIDTTMFSDPDVERIGMEITMRYERQCGWDPEDVSKENLGFDVRSTSPDGHRRYIEVKARAGIGAVALTQNEWFKAKRFQDEYYLYAVLNTSVAPVLYRVQNPGALLNPEEQVEVRYLVSVGEITSKGERA